ncbi:MAG: BspA family leucine-rich repeat surface protein [Firmicutes bacterium]|nr:BspA family leucine-rich repeat surface protein [Bacillota bacterium]
MKRVLNLRGWMILVLIFIMLIFSSQGFAAALDMEEMTEDGEVAGMEMETEIEVETEPESEEEMEEILPLAAMGARTVLYNDGTLIINEIPSNQTTNQIKHGAVVATYRAFGEHDYVFSSASAAPWYSNRLKVKAVEIGSTIAPTSTAYWFYRFENLETIDIQLLDTSNVTNMKYMFYYCGSQSARDTFSIDCTTMKTSKVTDMSYMFSGVGSTRPESIIIGGLASWDTRNVLNMSYMFENVVGNRQSNDKRSFTVVIEGYEGWDVSHVTNMCSMFDKFGKKVLNISLDFSGWDISEVIDMRSLFRSCGESSNNVVLNLAGWRFAMDANLQGMFRYFGQYANYTELTGIEDWDTSGVTNMSYMFCTYAGQGPASITWDLTKWDTSRVTSMKKMFAEIGWHTEKIELNLSGWNVSMVTDMSGMFEDIGRGYERLLGEEIRVYDIVLNLDLSGWKLGSNVNMQSMLSGTGQYAKAAYIVGLDTWDTSGVTDMSYMFHCFGAYADQVSAISFEAWNTFGVRNMAGMFYMCTANVPEHVVSGYENWDVSNVTSFYNMFRGFGKQIQTLIFELFNWKTESLTNMSGMFYDCGSETGTVTIKGMVNWNTSKVTNLSNLFFYTNSDDSPQAILFDGLRVPANCNVTSVLKNADGLSGTMTIEGTPSADMDFAWGTNLQRGEIFLTAKSEEGLAWAKKMVGFYGKTGTSTQGGVYLYRNFDFLVSESVELVWNDKVGVAKGDLTVVNLGGSEIRVKDICVESLFDGWILVTHTSNFAGLPKDSKMLSLTADGFDLSEGSYTSSESIGEGQSRIVALSSKTGLVSQPLERVPVVKLVVTIDEV